MHCAPVEERIVVSETDEFLLITTEAMSYKWLGTKDERLNDAMDDDFAVDYIRVYDIVDSAVTCNLR